MKTNAREISHFGEFCARPRLQIIRYLQGTEPQAHKKKR